MKAASAWAMAAGLAVAAAGAAATTMSPDPMLFQGVFAKPAVQAAALRGPKGARFAAQMRLTNNSREPIRISTASALTLEVVDAKGATVPFAGGANSGRAVRAADAIALAPGKSLTLPMAGTLRLAGRELAWRGDDGVMGTWQVDPARAYSLRLRYHGLDTSAWRGEGASLAAPLPLKG
jgi:hypothetical protein